MTTTRFTKWQMALLGEARVARLATNGPSGHPHIVPVCFALVDGCLAIPVDEKPKRSLRLARLRNIERDPSATVLVDRYDDDWTHLAWVRCDGQATVLPKGEAWGAGIAGLRERYQQYRWMALEDLPLIRMTPERIAAWRWTPGPRRER